MYVYLSPRMGAFGKVYSGPQFTHLEGGTVGLTEFRGSTDI